MCLGIADDLQVVQASSGVWFHKILAFLEFLDGLEELIDAVGLWYMQIV